MIVNCYLLYVISYFSTDFLFFRLSVPPDSTFYPLDYAVGTPRERFLPA